MGGHEVDRLGRHVLRGHHQVALVLAVGRVDDDHHAARANVLDRLLDRGERPLPAELRVRIEYSARLLMRSPPIVAEPLEMPSLSTYLREHVRLEVDAIPRAERAERRDRERVRDERHREAVVVEAGDRQPRRRRPHGALLDRRSAHDLRRRRERAVARLPLRLDASDLADGVDVALHPVTAHRVADAERGLEVHPIAGREPAERRAPQRLGTASNASDRAVAGGHGEAAPVDRRPSRRRGRRRRSAAPRRARSTPPPDGSHDRTCPDSMTMPVNIYGSSRSRRSSQHIRADARARSSRGARQLDVTA